MNVVTSKYDDDLRFYIIARKFKKIMSSSYEVTRERKGKEMQRKQQKIKLQYYGTTCTVPGTSTSTSTVQAVVQQVVRYLVRYHVQVGTSTHGSYRYFFNAA